jgi:flagellar motor switch protein FliN/FliY
MTEATTTEEQTPSQEQAEGVEVREAELPEVEPGTVQAPGGQLDILLDTTVQVSVRLGQTEMPARELIQLGPGSVVTLDRRAGQPVELLLRGIPFALGKLVVVGEQLGVKIEQILSPEEREGP